MLRRPGRWPVRDARPAALIARLAAIAAIVGACGATLSPVPSASPSAPEPLALGIDWGRVTAIDRPAGFDIPGADASLPVPDTTGRSGHPMHFSGQAMLADVVPLPAGGFVSVGYVYPGWHAAAWTSADGTTWAIRDMGAEDFTLPVSVAVGSDGTIVAVGRSGAAATAWTSEDGTSWQSHPVSDLAGGTIAARMTTVTPMADGFVAGGSVGPELADRHARFWASADGATWTPIPDDPTAFADAEVRSITRFGSGFVAVGVVGTAQKISGSVAWTSPDGRAWTRVRAPDLDKGRAVAVVPGPTDQLVAVGSDLQEAEAEAWTSPDGRAWTIAPPEPARQYPGKIRMTDVTVVGDELIAVGNFVGVQFGTATSWVSSDAVHWRQARSAPVLEQGEIYAVAPGGPGAVAVGSFGAPDNYIPTIWLTPAR